MLALSGDARIFMHTDPIDLRKGFEGLKLYDRVSFPKNAVDERLFCIFK